MSCGCGTSSKKSSSGKQDPQNLYLTGSFLAGAKVTFLSIKKTVPIKKVVLPNKFVFSENPCVGVGDGIILENRDLANCLSNFAADCYTVQTAPVLVGSDWEITVDGAWGSNSAGVTEFLFQADLGYEACGNTAAAKSLSIKVCSGTQNPANWSGSIYSKTPNSTPISGAVKVVNGSVNISAIGTPKTFRPKIGDSVELAGTAITGSNEAIILNSYPDGQVLLDRPVTGITVAPNADGNICVRASAHARPVAGFVFQAKCKCAIEAILDKSITSSRNFPPGMSNDNGGKCPGQDYCFTIIDSTPGTAEPVYSGIITLS